MSSNKFEGHLIAKLYFHTAFLSTNTSCIKVKLKDLDGVASDGSGLKDQRFPPNFKVVVNFRPEKEIKQMKIHKSPSKALALLFASQAEHESNQSMMDLGRQSSSDLRPESPFTEVSSSPKVPPRLKKSASQDKTSRSSTPSSLKSNSRESGLRVEDLISPVVDLPPESHPKRSTSQNFRERENMPLDTNKVVPPDALKSNSLLLDLGFGPSSVVTEVSIPQQNQNESQNETTANKSTAVDNLLDISGIASSTLPAELKNDQIPRDMDLFGTDQIPVNDTIIGSTNVGIKSSSSGNDLFMVSDNSAATDDSNINLLGDFGDLTITPLGNSSTQKSTSEKPSMNPTAKPSSTADDLINNLLSGLEMNNASATKSQGQNNGPNYNSSFFSEPAKKQSFVPQMSSKKVAPDTFNDLLGGFTAASQTSNETKTIGEMMKKEEMKQMTPTEANVFAWKDGKEGNLRALLCSLDKILWDGARWQKCGMHQLVTENDVNKMYKKALLAVHPDRQQGTENEELSTLLQSELNMAWKKYKDDLS